MERAFGRDPDSSLVAAAAADGDGLCDGEIVSNAAVLLFGGIETTEGMIANSIFHVLSHPDERAQLKRDPALVGAAVEESLRSSRPPRSSIGTQRAPWSSPAPGSATASS